MTTLRKSGEVPAGKLKLGRAMPVRAARAALPIQEAGAAPFEEPRLSCRYLCRAAWSRLNRA
ncbi:hypothetical protein [Deinococcus sp. UYEF24]